MSTSVRTVRDCRRAVARWPRAPRCSRPSALRVTALPGEGQVGAPLAGSPPAPKLVGRDPREGFPFGQDPKLVKTVGNYWPYATTVFDYVRRTMPITAPGSLTNNEVYAVVAFLLAKNEVIEPTAVMNSSTLPAVRMPARDKFVVDDRKGGAGFK